MTYHLFYEVSYLSHHSADFTARPCLNENEFRRGKQCVPTYVYKRNMLNVDKQKHVYRAWFDVSGNKRM